MKRFKLYLLVGVAVSVLATIYLVMHRSQLAVLNPKGEIALKQRQLIIFTSLLSLVVVLPVFAMLFGFAWRYRDGRKDAKYRPNHDHNLALEAIWWLVPLALISVLAVVTWRSSHTLDPSRPLASKTEPVKIQVVALQWRWLFIYPKQGVASLNYVQFPEDTPVDFEITADAPMNSLWIPQLAGQVYAMSGMSTNLHVMADEVGDYRGESANISGRGFADMNFVAHASTASDFDDWVAAIKQHNKLLDKNLYDELAKPKQDQTARTYRLADARLYDEILAKYMPNHSHGGGR